MLYLKSMACLIYWILGSYLQTTLFGMALKYYLKRKAFLGHTFFEIKSSPVLLYFSYGTTSPLWNELIFLIVILYEAIFWYHNACFRYLFYYFSLSSKFLMLVSNWFQLLYFIVKILSSICLIISCVIFSMMALNFCKYVIRCNGIRMGMRNDIVGFPIYFYLIMIL